MEKKRAVENNRILKFDQSGEYFSRRAQRQLDKSDLWGALASLRRAAQKEPDSSGHRMGIAEILAQMGLYELSNEHIFHTLIDGNGGTAECYFALSCNFFALRMPKLSRDCIANYLQLEPTGEYAPDCEDMLYLLEQEVSSPSEIAPASQIAADEGKEALDDGQYMLAIQKLTEALAADENMLYARNNLALAYFCAHETDRAIAEANRALDSKKDDVYALCNMALFLNGKGDKAGAREYAARAAALPAPDDEELYKLCITYADLGLDREALARCGEILKYSPYDENVLYLSALAQYNTGAHAGAYRTAAKLLLLDPDDALYQYVHSAAAKALGSGKAAARLDYALALPTGEALRRFDELRAFFSMPEEKAAERFSADARLRSSARWCFTLDDADMKQELALWLARLNTRESVRTLLMQLVSLDQSDDFKKNLAIALNAQTRFSPPYTAIISESLAEIRLKQVASPNARIPVGYERVLHGALEDIAGRYTEKAARIAMHLWINYMMGIEGRIPALKNENGWIAALVYAAVRLSGGEISEESVAREYKTRKSAILERYQVFSDIFKTIALE